MGILNYNVSWATAPATVRKTFFGIPGRTFLQAGTTLYRFLSPTGWYPGVCESNLVNDPFFPGNRIVSHCFIDYETFRDIVHFARDTDIAIAAVAQPALGVKPDWNPTMAEFGCVRLQQPVFGLKGPCNMKLYNRQLRSGGLDQIWIPNLNADIARPEGRARVEELTPRADVFSSSTVRLRS